jgi:hypothetical protein
MDALFLKQSREHSLDLRLIADVARVSRSIASICRDRFPSRSAGLFAYVKDANVRSVSRKAQRDCLSNAAARTGDHGHPAV